MGDMKEFIWRLKPPMLLRIIQSEDLSARFRLLSPFPPSSDGPHSHQDQSHRSQARAILKAKLAWLLPLYTLGP